MGAPETKPEPTKKPTKKICCACPDTKVSELILCREMWVKTRCLPSYLTDPRSSASQKARDECVTLHGPESKQCQELIEAHKRCLRAEGFDV